MERFIPYLDSHGLGEPLDDGEERVGGEHGGLVTLGVDDLGESVGGGGQPSGDTHTLEAWPGHSAEPRSNKTQHFKLCKKKLLFATNFKLDPTGSKLTLTTRRNGFKHTCIICIVRASSQDSKVWVNIHSKMAMSLTSFLGPGAMSPWKRDALTSLGHCLTGGGRG